MFISPNTIITIIRVTLEKTSATITVLECYHISSGNNLIRLLDFVLTLNNVPWWDKYHVL